MFCLNLISRVTLPAQARDKVAEKIGGWDLAYITVGFNAPKCLALSKIGIPVVQIRADKGSFLYIDEDELLNYDNEEIKTA